MAGRPKTATRELLTRDAASDAMRQMLEAQVELEKLQGAMDLARAAATARYEKEIDAKKSVIDDLSEQLQTWYLTHAEVAPDRKSIDLAYGTIGERTSPPALVPLNRKWSWKAICAKLLGTHGPDYFHPAGDPKPDKDKIRAGLTEEQLKICGLRIEHEESLFIELDRTSLGDAK